MRMPIRLLALCALLLGLAPAAAHEEAAPSDLPTSVAAPPLRTVKAKEIARVVGRFPFAVPGHDAIFFFRDRSLFRLDLVDPHARRERRLIEDERIEEALLDHAVAAEYRLTPFLVNGRPFAVFNALPTALLLDLEQGRVFPIRGRAGAADPVTLEVENLVLDRATSVLCYARVTSGPSKDEDVWTKLDLSSGDATLLPCPDCQRSLSAKGGVFLDGTNAVEIDTGRRLPRPDTRVVPYYEYDRNAEDGVGHVLIEAMPLRFDLEGGTRAIGVAHAGQAISPVLFPKDVREPYRAKMGDGFAAYLVSAENLPHYYFLFLAETQPDAKARRVAELSYLDPFAITGGGHCVFRDARDRTLVYSFDGHTVFDPFEGTAPPDSLPASSETGTVSSGHATVSSGLGTAPAGVWGAVQLPRRVYPAGNWGMDMSWPVLPLTVLVSPRGNRFVVDYPEARGAYGPAALLFNRGVLVLPATFDKLRRAGSKRQPRPGFVLYDLSLPDESPRPRPASSRTPAEPPAAVDRVLESGLYLRQEISPPSDGRWIGLLAIWTPSWEERLRALNKDDDGSVCFPGPDYYELAECSVTTRGLESGAEALRALEVSASCAVAPGLMDARDILLVRDIPGLTLGRVEMARMTEGACCGAPAVDPKGADEWRLGEARYRIETVPAPTSESKQLKVLRLSRGSVTQDLLKTEHEAKVRKAFDLDRDGRLDLYVDERLPSDTVRGEKRRSILFLSSAAAPGDLVGEASRIEAEPIGEGGSAMPSH